MCLRTTPQVYVIVLITMPTFMYMITGLSLVLQNFELIIIFKNIATAQASTTGVTDKFRQIRRNKQLMRVF